MKETSTSLVSDAFSQNLETVLCKVSGAVMKMADNMAEDAGFKVGHYQILLFLSKQGAVSQQEISEAINVDRSTMTDYIDSLEQAGFVERRKQPNDRRAYAIHLLPEGRKAYKASEGLVDTFRDAAFSALTDAERQTLLKLLLKLANAGYLPKVS